MTMSNHIQARKDFFIVSQLPKTVNPFLRFILSLINEKPGGVEQYNLSFATFPAHPSDRVDSQIS